MGAGVAMPALPMSTHELLYTTPARLTFATATLFTAAFRVSWVKSMILVVRSTLEFARQLAYLHRHNEGYTAPQDTLYQLRRHHQGWVLR